VAALVAASAGCGGSLSTWRFFTEEEGRTLEAMLEQVIPADDAPGAKEAGVIRYIDRQLVGPFRNHGKTYQDGIAASNRRSGGAFHSAPADRQQQLLAEMEQDPATRPFFELLVAHAMQGFYGNPRHGGNRDFGSWRMLGIPPVPVRGRDRYELPNGGSVAQR
jgi:gluconate 2-dehydrogenase gamma chain